MSLKRPVKETIIIYLSDISAVWSNVWPVLAAILFFGFIILVHELGHFSAAKLFKVKVNEFSIGMGPVLFKKHGKETDYSLRAFPIGGFVSMEGEDSESDDEHSFSNQYPWKKAVILAAGAFNNILLGLIIMAVILSQDLIGIPQVAAFSKDAVSSNYGLSAGDTITEVNGHRIYTEYDLSFYMQRDTDSIMDFAVERDGKTVILRSVKFAQTESGGKTYTVYDFSITGLKPTFAHVVKYSFLDSASIARMVLVSFGDIFTGNFDPDDLSGPIGTVGIIADTAQQAETTTDYSSLMIIMALITINIGVFNLLPLPALDGGHLFFVFLEGVRRKKVPAKVEAAIHSAGLAALLILMVIVTFNDIFNLVKG